MVMKLRWGRLVVLALMSSNVALAEDAPDWSADTLTGDWGGARAALYDRGVTVELAHTSDLLANTSGGLARGGAWLMNTDASIGLDLDKLAGWGGGSAFVEYHFQHGNQAQDFNGAYVGSFAGVSNIETGTTTGQFYQAWAQQNSADDSLSLLAGLYAIDSEFYVTDSSGLFLQPPYGMSAEMAQAGRNGPPVFPMGALGIRLKYTGSNFYAQGAVTDGVPGNPNDPRGTQIRLDKGDGALSLAEFGYTPEVAEGQISKTSLGMWRYTARANDLVEVDAFGNPIQRIDQGFYVLTEQVLYSEQNNAGQGLVGFARFGTVNKDAYQADWSVSLGLNYQGLLDGRDDDAAGIAITTSHASDKYRQLMGSTSAETVIEMTYSAQLFPWLSVQPSLQRIIHPNMNIDPNNNVGVQSAWVAGLRFDIAL